ncbi:aldolase [Bradyrhizobium neotropicale]|uniref:aldolase n=1 Tax=Bradyrhizobium neotropicale TaxID=1497615 RepID=UPI001AD63B81|nr:aldolase [Bradyrhizobium neotropicale]MBO4224594.1 aldolase [Bradyrhizobium neotropicale]
MPAKPQTTTVPKASHVTRVDAELESLHGRSTRSERDKLALTAHILADEGHFGGLAGQLTARFGQNHFLTLPLGIGFDEAKASDILVVDDDLNVVEGHGIPNPATRFHLWIYRHKPNVHSIVHTHPPATSALSVIGQPLIIAHMDMCMFQDQCAYLPDWPGLPIGDEEGVVISSALGDCKTILLANHGLITAGSSIEEAAYLAFFFERAAALQLAASASGTIRPVDPKKAREAGDFLLKPKIVEMTFEYLARKIERGASAPSASQ